MPDAQSMINNKSEIEQAAFECELAVMHALTGFAGKAMRLGEREHAIEGMARAVLIADQMIERGRCDNSVALMRTAELLEVDGIRAEVFARASAMRGEL
jgi:hypothetical protein